MSGACPTADHYHVGPSKQPWLCMYHISLQSILPLQASSSREHQLVTRPNVLLPVPRVRMLYGYTQRLSNRVPSNGPRGKLTGRSTPNRGSWWELGGVMRPVAFKCCRVSSPDHWARLMEGFQSAVCYTWRPVFMLLVSDWKSFLMLWGGGKGWEGEILVCLSRTERKCLHADFRMFLPKF